MLGYTIAELQLQLEIRRSDIETQEESRDKQMKEIKESKESLRKDKGARKESLSCKKCKYDHSRQKKKEKTSSWQSNDSCIQV